LGAIARFAGSERSNGTSDSVSNTNRIICITDDKMSEFMMSMLEQQKNLKETIRVGFEGSDQKMENFIPQIVGQISHILYNYEQGPPPSAWWYPPRYYRKRNMPPRKVRNEGPPTEFARNTK
jgi:hypothetical protein